MKKEDLIALGLTDDQASEVFKIRGKEIDDEKARYSLLQSEKAVVDNAYSQLKANVDKDYVAKDKFEKYKNEKKALEVDIENLKKSHESQVNEIKYNAVLEKHLSEAGARNVELVKTVLNKDSLKFEDGVIVGIEDALKAMKESKDTDFLFADEGGPSRQKFTQRQNDGSQGGGSLTKESIMSIQNHSDRIKAIQENPELFN